MSAIKNKTAQTRKCSWCGKTLPLNRFARLSLDNPEHRRIARGDYDIMCLRCVRSAAHAEARYRDTRVKPGSRQRRGG